jgi:hypothetical protein
MKFWDHGLFWLLMLCAITLTYAYIALRMAI